MQWNFQAPIEIKASVYLEKSAWRWEELKHPLNFSVFEMFQLKWVI